MDPATIDRLALDAAYEQACLGRDEGGIPIGRNRRVQHDDPTAHAEVDCIRQAGRRRDWRTLTLASTLSPCVMCTGTALLFRIPRVVVGESQTFQGAEDLFARKGVTLVAMHDPRCVSLMQAFIAAKPDLWAEDIGE